MATLMVQGTTSDAGKSTLVAAICRSLRRRGLSVAPFKPQNMALNSAVTEDGGEIGRAQALQAEACGLLPHIDMNPVLLKPCTDIGAQVIVHGKAVGNMSATSYHQYKQVAFEAVMTSHQRLSERYDYVIVEGAGSPAEINLRDRDIANMGFAEAADCPVILVADIDRGGVFAHLVGTLALLSDTERARVKGFIINRFRGDISLLQSGLDWLEEETGLPVLGVMPYLHQLYLDAEDAIQVEHAKSVEEGRVLKVIAPVLPRISNHTDFDALQLHPQVDFQFVGLDQEIPPADLVILPGSKSVIDDMLMLKSRGWEDYLKKHLRYGGKVLGICGGYQMLGRSVADPEGIEGDTPEAQGFGLLDCVTVLQQEKVLRNRKGQLSKRIAAGDDTSDRATYESISGYEIHVGETQGEDCVRPFVEHGDSNGEQTDGAISEDGAVAGSYWHGLFDSPSACQRILAWAGLEAETGIDVAQIREQQLDRLTDAFEESHDMQTLLSLLEPDLIKAAASDFSLKSVAE